MRVFFLVINEMRTSVVPSQVLAPARAWAAELGIEPHVIFLEPARVAFSREGRRTFQALQRLGPRLHLWPYVGRLGRHAPALSLRAFLRWQGATRPVLHCRGPEATLQAIQAVGARGRVIFDARGAAAPEARLRLAAAGRSAPERWSAAVLATAETEREAVARADAISAVSAPLAARLAPPSGKPVAVVPCCVAGPTFLPEARERVRRSLSLADGELLLVHTSTEARWEDFPQVLAFFREIASRRPARLLFLTPLPEAEVTGSLAPEDPLRAALLVRRAAPGEVPAFLAAADVGLLLRRPHEAFQVSSPIKFAEYLAAGLAVVVNAGIGSAAEVVASRNLGIAVDGPLSTAAHALLSLLETGQIAVRERALAACRELYTWERYAPEVARLYSGETSVPPAPARLYSLVQTEMLTGGVIEAQVVAALRAQSRVAGQPATRLLFLEPFAVARSARAREVLAAFRRMWPAGRLSLLPFVSRLGDAAPGRFLAARLWRERFSRSPLIFHCRGPEATWTGHLARRLLGPPGRSRVIFDLRGHGPYETLHRLGYPTEEELPAEARRIFDRALAIDRRAAGVADRIFTVSPGLRRYAIEDLGARPEAVTVVPSCVEAPTYDPEARRRLRMEWGVPAEAPVLVYSGRLGPERLPELMLGFFREVWRREPAARLLLLIYRDDLGDLPRRLSEIGLPAASVLVRTLSRDQATEALSAADAGLLFHEAAARYQEFQAPIKVAEYLAAGLALAVTPGVGRIPDLVAQEDIGWIVAQDGENLGEVAAAFLADDRMASRARALGVCTTRYLWRNHVPAIRRAYGLERGDE